MRIFLQGDFSGSRHHLSMPSENTRCETLNSRRHRNRMGIKKVRTPPIGGWVLGCPGYVYIRFMLCCIGGGSCPENFCWRRIRRHGHKRQQNFYDFRTQNSEESLRVLWNLDFYSKKQAKGLRGRNICRAKCYTLFLSKGRRAKAVGKPMKWLEVD